jgi:hypothetical protein
LLSFELDRSDHRLEARARGAPEERRVTTRDDERQLTVDNVFNFPTIAEAYKYTAYDGLQAVERAST